jgi:hypothetical protein
VISSERKGDVMEGGMSVRDVLKWAKGKKLIDILELSLSHWKRILTISVSKWDAR